MFRPKMVIIGCLKSCSYKDTAVFTIIIGIDLFIIPGMSATYCHEQIG
jgi:hypothetical protein